MSEAPSPELVALMPQYLSPWMRVLVYGCAPQLVTHCGCSMEARAATSAVPPGPWDAVVVASAVYAARSAELVAALQPGVLLLLLDGPAAIVDSKLIPVATHADVLCVLRRDDADGFALSDLRRELAIFASSWTNDNRNAPLDATQLFAHSTRERNELTRRFAALAVAEAPDTESATEVGVRSADEVRVRAIHFRSQSLALAAALTPDAWLQIGDDGRTAYALLQAWNRQEKQLFGAQVTAPR